MNARAPLPPATEDDEYHVVWEPLPGSQSLALCCVCHHILVEGTRGPGKTAVQLARFRARVGMGYGPQWRGVIFDREYKNLDDLVSKSVQLFTKFDDGAKFVSGSGYKWVWPTGEELLFRAIKRGADYWNYHGQEFPFIGWNELTKYPTSELYDAMMSCNRSSFIPGAPGNEEGLCEEEMPLETFSTTNPFGPGHNWVKHRFIDKAPPGVVVRNTINVFNPRKQRREDVVKTQVRIFCSYKENIYLAPEYIAELESIKDPNKRKAWLWGDWDIVSGGALDDVWGPHLKLPRFKIPSSWRIDRSFDWGSSRPFSVGWWAEANGEEATLPDGTKFCPPAKTLIRIDEWYGTEEIGTNLGLKLTAKKVAKGIKEREAQLRILGWVHKDAEFNAGPADNSIFDLTQQNGEELESIASKMEDEGVYWEHCDKRPGSRINGLQVLRDMMEASRDWVAKKEVNEGCIFYMENCLATEATLPVLPRDETNPDDVDTDAEDHAYDEWRYRALKGSNRSATDLNLKFVR